jgi:ABC-type branched-subunit amino acid transport system ATPase component/ABC-type branched-subunit amino acid transport system permease subunit
VSLCQAAFAAIGATTMGHLTAGFGLPWGVALLLAGLAAVPIGAFIAIPAIRLPGVFLALATFGFGVTMEQMGYPLWLMFGSSSLGQAVNRPAFAQGDIAYYYLLLAFVVAASLLVVWLVRSRLGRLLRGMADSPVALATHGTSVLVTRVLVFCVAAFLAGVSGALFGGVVHTVTSSDFAAFSSLTLLALLVVIPGREPWYAFGAGFALVVLPSWISTGATVADWLNVLFGLAAVQVALGFTPRHERLHEFLDRIGGRGRSPAPASSPQEATGASGVPPAPAPAEPARALPAVTGASSARLRPGPGAAGGLDLTHVTVRYGGHVAVNDVSLTAPVGRITGLIGPNGAGKTTLFNVASGLVRPAVGTLRLHGADMSALDPAARARRGLGRTFQKMELFDSLTARANVSLGREAGQAGARPWRHLAETSQEQRHRGEVAEQAMALAGIADLADRPVAALSTGQRRLVELARCLAGEFDVLLLDEPSSGLDGAETERFGVILTRVVAERGVGILLVEHDMALVMNICDYVHVLDFGTKIFEGSTADVSSSDTVRAAYLGTEPARPQPKMAR